MYVDYVIQSACKEAQAIAHWSEYLLPPSWLKRLEYSNNQEQTLIGRMLLFRRMATLGYNYTNLPEMKYTIQGKPYFEENIYFGFSYNQDMILVATSDDQPIGIDVETIRPISWQSFESHFPKDKWFRISRNSNPTKQLIDSWVVKEATNKLEGLPERSQKNDSIKYRNQKIYANGQKYYYQDLDLPVQYIGKVVTQQKVKNLKISNLTNQLNSQSMLYAVRA
jgi:phosphopantetheinyl transferase